MVQDSSEPAEPDNSIRDAVGGDSRTNQDKQGISGSSKTTITLDDWQREVIETQGKENICLRSGRQVGKSTVISVLTAEYATSNPKKSVMVISATERQAYLLFSKILGYLLDNYRGSMKSGKDRPTKSEIKLKNGTIIRCLPTGLDGIGIRGYTVDLLIADEAAYIPEDVWPAVTPMLATTKGVLIMLSTPRGIGNFFYDCYHNPQFKTWHISSEDCPRISKEFLEYEKKRLTRLHYKQEYLGEFTDKIRQIFPDALLREHMTKKRTGILKGVFSLGVDIARMGGDLCTFEILKREGDILYQVENWTTENILIPDTINKVKEYNRLYKNLEKIYIDTGGMGAAVFDFLLREPETKRKVVSIDNATRPVERDSWYKGRDKLARKARLMKEQGIMNLKRLMEQNRIWLLDDEDIFFSLKAYQWDDESEKILGEGTHIAEGIWRAAWFSQEKINKVYIDYI